MNSINIIKHLPEGLSLVSDISLLCPSHMISYLHAQQVIGYLDFAWISAAIEHYLHPQDS